jgi:hypothetical protein
MINFARLKDLLASQLSKYFSVAGKALHILFHPIRSVPLQFLLSGLIVLFAVGFNWVTATRGIYLYDYSIVFDGAWRVLQGQIPYRDFAMSHAPLAYFLLAAAFKWFGVSFGTFIGFASVLNGIGVLASIRIARRLAPGTEFLVGIVTAVWYLPIMGFPQIEHVAFCFNFLCLWCLTEFEDSKSLTAYFFRFLSGFLLFCACMTKQNAGTFFAPILLLYLSFLAFRNLKDKFLSIFVFCCGFAFALSLFLAWLWLYCDPLLFKHHFFDVPAKFGGDRIARLLSPMQFIYKVVLGITPLSSVQVLNLFAYLALGLVFIKLALRSYSFKGINVSRSSILLGLVLFHYLFCSSMMNQPESGMPFLGLMAGLTITLFRETLSGLELRFTEGHPLENRLALSSSHSLLTLPFLMMFVLLFVQGAKISWQRTANEFTVWTTFLEPISFPALKPLKWGAPTLQGVSNEFAISSAQFEGLIRFLEKRDQKFFVFPVSTILYGLLNKPSPAPWLFFYEGHSFAKEDLPRLDNQAIANFQELPVCIWVKESDSWIGEHKELYKLPKTFAWLNQNFKKVQQFGPYEVLENTSCPK